MCNRCCFPVGRHRARGPGASWCAAVVVAARQPRVPELAHRVDDRQHRRALLRQLVLDARRRLGVAAPLEHALLLERAEALGERARADAAARLLELREAARPLGEVVHEQRGPLRADDLGRGRDGAGRRLVDGVHRPVHRLIVVAASDVERRRAGLDLRDARSGRSCRSPRPACRPGRRRHRRRRRGR